MLTSPSANSLSVARERVAAAAALGPNAAKSPATSLGARQEGFSEILGQSRDRLGPAEGKEQRARRAAEEFVSSALIEPILKSLRESNHTAPPFAPGPAEKQFRGLIDTHMARQIAHSSRFPLVDRLARDLLNKPPVPTPNRPVAQGITA